MPYPDIKISFIIVNYNGGDFIGSCVKSIYENLARDNGSNKSINRSKIDFEIIAVDNCSSDGSLEILREIARQNSNFKLIENSKNAGFSKASNTGAENAEGDYLIFLNPDTKIISGRLEDLIRFHEREDSKNTNSISGSSGVTGARILNSDGTLQYSCRSFPTLARQFYESFFLSRIFKNNRVFGSYFLSWWDHGKTREVDWLSGSFMLIKKLVFYKIGMFDKRYFMYSEDCDLCLGLKKAGFKNYYYPFFVIEHEDSGIAAKNPAARELGILESRRIYYKKNYSGFAGFLFDVIYFLGILNRIILFFLLSLFGPGKRDRRNSRERLVVFLKVFSSRIMKTAEENKGRIRNKRTGSI